MITDIRQNTDARELKRIWHSGFGDSEQEIACFFETAYHPDRSHALFEDGRAVSALHWMDCTARGQRIAYLYAIATDARYRGRGYCRTLMEQTHRRLRELGYAGALLVPASDSLFDFYERLGYRTATYIRAFSCVADPQPIPLIKVSKQEYAARRRILLPEGGVLQEGACLDYLAARYTLYAGEGLVLAAACEEGVLRVHELLGESARAPAVVSALGCKRGEFRTPGQERRFSMYLSLDGTPAPSYFGLAFD